MRGSLPLEEQTVSEPRVDVVGTDWGRRFQRPAAWAAVLLLSLAFSFGAFEAFPIWDDGWLWLVIEQHGLEGIVPSHPERPVVVALWRLLASSPDAFWRWALAAQVVLWPGLAWLGSRLWRELFPDLSSLAPAVGFLAIAPFVTRVQMVTATVALASLPSVVLATAGVLSVLRFAGRGGWPRLVAGAGLVGAGVLLQEYAIPVALGGAVLVAWLGLRRRDVRRRATAGVGTLAAAAAVFYWLYLELADFSSGAARTELDPEGFLARAGLLKSAAMAVAQSVWRGLFAAKLEAFGVLRSEIARSPWILLWGLLIGGLLAWGCRPRATDDDRRYRWAWVPLVVALMAALTPPAIAGETPWSEGYGMASRFGIPAKPFLALLLVWCLHSWIPRRWLVLPLALLGGLGGALGASQVVEAITERRTVASQGDCLRPLLEDSEHLTVVVLPLPERSLGPRRQWELTARLVADYPPELSARLWAFRHGDGPELYYRDKAEQLFGPRERCRRPARLDRTIRNLERKGRVESLLWVERTSDGGIVIEPYCQKSLTERTVLARCESSEEP